MAADEELPFKVAEIDCSTNLRICGGYNIQHTPQMWIFYKRAPLHRMMGLRDGPGRKISRFPYIDYPMPVRKEEDTLDEFVLKDWAMDTIQKHKEWEKEKKAREEKQKEERKENL